eukprot:6692680-Prymnesium_polylepis.1
MSWSPPEAAMKSARSAITTILGRRADPLPLTESARAAATIANRWAVGRVPTLDPRSLPSMMRVWADGGRHRTAHSLHRTASYATAYYGVYRRGE